MRERWRDRVYGRHEADLESARVGSYHALRAISPRGRRWVEGLAVEPWRRQRDAVLISTQDFCAVVAQAQGAGLVVAGQFRPGLQDREPDAAEKSPPKVPWIW
jgi:hypothetical protein